MSINTKGAIEAIFVDFFDTLVLRHVTAKEVLQRWATCLQKKYPSLSERMVNKLPSIRLSIFKEKRELLLKQHSETTEVTYIEAIGALFEEVKEELGGVQKEKFIAFSREVDFAVEIGCEYANTSLVKELEIEKQKGKRLFVVSDFYLYTNDMKELMSAAGISQNLFEKIYVSCDVGKRKANGDIFPFILNETGLKPENVIMIGDNRESDYEIPASMGLHTDYRPNIVYKCKVHTSAKMNNGYAGKQYSTSLDEMFRHGKDYSEYIGIFYVFTKRLYAKLREDDVHNIAFMAREGFFMRQLFELYQEIVVPDNKKIDTTYYWCSRRSVMAGIKKAQMAEEIEGEISLKNWLKSLDISLDEARRYIPFTDEEAEKPQLLEKSELYKSLIENKDFFQYFEDTIKTNYEAFMKYTEPYIVDNKFRFVDSGWKCTTQNTIQDNYGINTVGYYIGVQKPDKPILELERTGLIFCEEKPRSRYYDYLGTNIPFYQQLLSAPHGTALKYILEDGKVLIKYEWDPMEEKLYHENIEELQHFMLLKFRGLCAWDDKEVYDSKEDWYIAKLSMRSSLFANRSRLKFVRKCTDNYVQNFRQEKRGKVQYDVKKIKIGLDIIWKPYKMIRYLSKIQRTSLYDKKVIRMLYPIIAIIFYSYTLLIQNIKNLGTKILYKFGKGYKYHLS